MAEFSPHTDIYKIKGNLENINKIIFWLTLVLSILPILSKTLCYDYGFIDIINIFNIIGIAVFFIIDILNEYILLPLADNKRRDDFIDNSFGSKFSIKSSIDYYDNQEVEKGIYKAAVNQFENCFFTYSLVKISTVSKIVVPTVMLIIMSIIAYYGFSEVPFALTILQSFFSANILGDLIKHLILLNRLATIQDSWLQLFQNVKFKQEIDSFEPHILRYWLQYETLHSKINANISNNIFDKNNASLTEEWNKLKIKYDIN
jgi:nitrate reductase NapE component